MNFYQCPILDEPEPFDFDEAKLVEVVASGDCLHLGQLVEVLQVGEFYPSHGGYLRKCSW